MRFWADKSTVRWHTVLTSCHNLPCPLQYQKSIWALPIFIMALITSLNGPLKTFDGAIFAKEQAFMRDAKTLLGGQFGGGEGERVGGLLWAIIAADESCYRPRVVLSPQPSRLPSVQTPGHKTLEPVIMFIEHQYQPYLLALLYPARQHGTLECYIHIISLHF